MSTSLLSRITINPEMAHGNQPSAINFYTVEGMLKYLAAGDSIEELLAEFPDLERDDLSAWLPYV